MIPLQFEWKEHDVFDIQDDKSIIYMLYDKENKLIYIGQTVNFFSRMLYHLRNKEIKKIKYFYVEKSEADSIEYFLINLHLPKNNKEGKNSIKYGLSLAKRIASQSKRPLEKSVLDQGE